MTDIEQVIELKDRIFKNKLTPEEQRFIRQIYFNSTGKKKKGGCSTCFVEMFMELKSINPKQYIPMKDKLFLIEDGEVLSMHGVSESYTNANLNNRGALTMLKLNRGCIKFFTKVPENWASLVDKFDIRMTDDQADALVAGLSIKVSSKDISIASAINATSKMGECEIQDDLLSELNALDVAQLRAKAQEFGIAKTKYKSLPKGELVKLIHSKIKA